MFPLIASDGLVVLDPEISAKLAKTSHESTESIWEPGKHVYGISMFHQLHCLVCKLLEFMMGGEALI